MKILVTGASGFIGGKTLAPLVANGHDVIAVTSNPDKAFPEGVTPLVLNLFDHVAVKSALTDLKPDGLMHFAWQAVVGGLWTAPGNLDWVKNSMNLVEAFVEAGGSRVVASGSCGEYDWSAGLCHEDHTPLTPNTFYGSCKHALQTLMGSYCKNNDVSFAWGRSFFVYGPGEHQSRLGASVVKSILSGEPALCSHGMQLRDYIHVQDLADAYVALFDSKLDGTYNLATGQAIRVKDLIEALAKAAGRPDLVKLGARGAPAYEPPLIVADMYKTREALDWSPTFTLESGAEDTVASMRD